MKKRDITTITGTLEVLSMKVLERAKLGSQTTNQ